MTIIPLNPVTLDPRTMLMADIIGLIDDAATSGDPISAMELAEMIMWTIDHSGYVPEPPKETSDGESGLTPEDEAALSEMADELLRS